MNSCLLFLALGTFSGHIRAAVFYELDPEIREKTEDLLREKHVDYHHEATVHLKKEGRHFDRARIEVAGMLANDDTYQFNHSDFDDQIKPSYRADSKRSILDRIKTYARDMEEMKHAMRGEMTKRAVDTVSRFKDMEVNEIIAHSWGTELVYAAILNGDIRPPKKLIVTGVPDDDHAKWEMLAAHTGTEVIWVRAENDAAAMDKGARTARDAARNIDFKLKWDFACAKDASANRICHAHGRPSKPVRWVKIGNLPIKRADLFMAHARDEYYKALKRKDVGLIKQTVLELRAIETRKINAEAQRMAQDDLAAAQREATELVTQAREQKEIARRDREERERLERIEAGQKRFEEDLAERRRIDAIERQMRDYLREAHRSARTAPAPLNPPSLAAILPKLRDLAISACRFPEQVVISSQEFGYGNDPGPSVDSLAAELVVGLDSCSSRLFIELISKVRARDYADINRDWVRGKVFEFTPRAPSYYTPPPTGGRCEDYGNVHCPH